MDYGQDGQVCRQTFIYRIVEGFSFPDVPKRSDTLTMCKERLQLDLRAGLSRRFYSVYRPWPLRSCFIGWARISGKEGLLGGAFSTCC
jgi:hypothetical protein